MNGEQPRTFNTSKTQNMEGIIRVTINIVSYGQIINLIAFTYL